MSRNLRWICKPSQTFTSVYSLLINVNSLGLWTDGKWAFPSTKLEQCFSAADHGRGVSWIGEKHLCPNWIQCGGQDDMELLLSWGNGCL